MTEDSDLDAFDRKILDALQKDGKLTNGELAVQVGLSASQCSRRRAQLEKAGIITGYHAKLDPSKVGIGLTSIIAVSLATHDERNAERFRHLIADLANVQDALSLTGEMDYSIKVVSKDLDDLSTFINKTLLPHEAVSHVKTAIVLNILKTTSALPLD